MWKSDVWQDIGIFFVVAFWTAIAGAVLVTFFNDWLPLLPAESHLPYALGFATLVAIFAILHNMYTMGTRLEYRLDVIEAKLEQIDGADAMVDRLGSIEATMARIESV